jgi:hypothetical protein
MDIARLIESEDIRSVLREFACAYKPGMTAEDFLQLVQPEVRLSAKVSRALGDELKLRSTSNQTFVFQQSPKITCMAFVCALLANGIPADGIEQSPNGDALLLSGPMPSSALYWSGRITIQITTCPTGSDVSMVAEFPGQLIAWGAGKRLFRKLRSQLDKAAIRLHHCPSMSML